MEVEINECKKKTNEAQKLWLDLEKRFSLTNVGEADENDLNNLRQMVLTAKKMKRDGDQMSKTISSLVLIKKLRI